METSLKLPSSGAVPKSRHISKPSWSPRWAGLDFPNKNMPILICFSLRHQLAPISGSIEHHETPEEAAWRELKEETTLTPRDVALWRQGKPYSFSDPSIHRIWNIFPFLFRLKPCHEGGRGEEGVRIDWEHDSWQWYNPELLNDNELFGGVPRLRESLQRVWFEMHLSYGASKVLRAGLEQLKADHQSGSHELTSIALKVFQDVISQIQGPIGTDWWESARMVAWHLWKNGRESMGAATLNALLGLLAKMEDTVHQDLSREIKWKYLLGVLGDHMNKRKQMPTRIEQSFGAYLQSDFMSTMKSNSTRPLTILTLSGSSTIRDSIIGAFASLPIPRLDLRVLESRPLCEGVKMASSMLSTFKARFPSSSGRNVNLKIYTDASAALASKGVDFVLLGADQISDSGSISNKIGSLPAVLSAKHVCSGVKVLILSELEKVAELGVENGHVHEENNPSELIGCWMDCGIEGIGALVEDIGATDQGTATYAVKVKNVYFEWVPPELIDAYICEEGTLDVAAIQNKAQQVKQNSEKYFGEL
jgi:translation initiation factor 2B subunit (eIF-2B alpha/beta/delta family)/8-oxo-dGTP pyrophosphatase MutT (NUDIX family)